MCLSLLLSFCQRYSAPQSPINVIILRPFDRWRTASISARSESERRNRNTFRLSSGCSETPRRVPTRTAPTNGWSRTQRTAMLAMLTPPWRSPTLRNMVRSRWKRPQSPHTLVIASRYLRCDGVSALEYGSGSGLSSQASARKPPQIVP